MLTNINGHISENIFLQTVIPRTKGGSHVILHVLLVSSLICADNNPHWSLDYLTACVAAIGI